MRNRTAKLKCKKKRSKIITRCTKRGVSQKLVSVASACNTIFKST